MTPNTTPDCSFLAPVRYSAWLAGELGKTLQTKLEAHVHEHTPGATVDRLPRGFHIKGLDGNETALPIVSAAMRELEGHVAGLYPVFHHEMGPVWTGTIQAVCTP